MTQPIENQQVIKAIIYLQEIGKIPINAELSRILLEKVKYKASEQYISQVQMWIFSSLLLLLPHLLSLEVSQIP